MPITIEEEMSEFVSQKSFQFRFGKDAQHRPREDHVDLLRHVNEGRVHAAGNLRLVEGDRHMPAVAPDCLLGERIKAWLRTWSDAVGRLEQIEPHVFAVARPGQRR